MQYYMLYNIVSTHTIRHIILFVNSYFMRIKNIGELYADSPILFPYIQFLRLNAGSKVLHYLVCGGFKPLVGKPEILLLVVPRTA